MTTTGFIYRLWSPDSQEFYIGSTTNPRKRRYNHKSACNTVGSKLYNLPLYRHIRANGGWGAWRMEIEQQVQFTHRHELNRIEGKFIRRLSPSLNKAVAGRTKGEYYQDNREAMNERTKHYYQEHKATLAEKAKRYRHGNREAIRRALTLKQYKKHECLCGGRYTHQHRFRHFQSQWHNIMAEYIELYEYIVQC